MIVDLVRTQTSDGLRLDGALHAAAGTTPSGSVDAMVCLSGVGSNFYGSTLIERICVRLAENGIAAVRVNTRGHDGISTASTTFGGKQQGAAYEIVDDCRLDISAWIEFLAQQGHARIGLLGHSLGAIKVLYAQAHEADPRVQKIIAISPPCLSYQRFQSGANAAEFQSSLSAAEALQSAGQAQQLFPASFPFPLIISANTYLDKYGRADRYDILNFSPKIECPVAFIYGGQEITEDSSAFRGIVEDLERVTWQPNLRPEIRVIPAANHFYSGSVTQLIDTVSEISFLPPSH